MNRLTSAEGHGRLLRAWQLAILRFAITLDDSDRLNAGAIAAELDRQGRCGAEDSLRFFRRTSSRLCAAICAPQENTDAILECFCKEIDEPRLRAAFAAAAGLAPPRAAPSPVRPKRDLGLFRGLPARRAASL